MMYAFVHTPKGRMMVIGLSEQDYQDLAEGKAVPINVSAMCPGYAPHEILLVTHEDDPKDMSLWTRKACNVLRSYVDGGGNG